MTCSNPSTVSFLSLSLCFLLTATTTTTKALSDWHVQNLGNSEAGQHTGVAIYDLNGDGYDDVLISAGRHAVDQSFALINLGFDEETKEFRFSEPLSLGIPGGYYQVDVSPLSSLAEGHLAVLLAGGTCSVPSACVRGTHTPALLLDVFVSGCSVQKPDGICQIESSVIWHESPATGNRNGVLSSVLTDGGDPAIVLVGIGRLTVHHPVNGTYPTEPDYVLLAEDKIDGDDDYINRGAGLAVGYIGKQKGIIVGPRSRGSLAPAPIIVVYRRDDGVYYHWNIEEGEKSQERYSEQSTGLALADLNGDGNVDIVKTGFQPNTPRLNMAIAQGYILVDEDPQDDVPLDIKTLLFSRNSGRSVATGQIYPDSDLPDIVYGMEDGTIKFFANQGKNHDNDTRSKFAGFQLKETLDAGLFDCQIRDIAVASLHPCTTSVICAMTCGPGIVPGNYMFTSVASQCVE